MKAKRSNYGGVLALLVIGAAGVYGVGTYISRTPDAAKVPDVVRRADAAPQPPADKQNNDEKSAKVLTPKSSGGNLTFESKNEKVPKGTSPLVFALNRYLENTKITPPHAKVLSVEVKEGAAYFDCTEAMDKTYGSGDEETLIQGMIKTLSQFPEIKKFYLLVSGKSIETFGGVDLTEGIEITPEDEPSTTPGA